MNLHDKTTAEIIELYSGVIKELKNRNIIRTNNVIGDLGEFLAIDYYNKTPGLPNLAAAPIGTENIDAISRQGNRYSIKSTSGNTTGIFYGLEPIDSKTVDSKKFEFVLVCKFNKDYELETILELDWDSFIKHKSWHSRMKAWNLSLTKALYNDGKIVYKK